MYLVSDNSTLPEVSIELVQKAPGMYKIIAKKRITTKDVVGKPSVGKTMYTIEREVKDLHDYVRVSKLLLRLDNEFWQM
jgi:hypothetical protein